MRELIICVAIMFTACNAVDTSADRRNAPSPTPVAQHPSDNVRRVTTTELAELMKEGKAIVVDVRNKDSYDQAHIAGARWIPVMEIAQRFNELPRDKMIVTYCS